MTNSDKINGSFWIDEDTQGTFHVYADKHFWGNLMGKPFHGTYCKQTGLFEIVQIETRLGLDKEIHGNFLVSLDLPHEALNLPYEGEFSWNPRAEKNTFTVCRPFPQFMHKSWRTTFRHELVKEYFIKLKNRLATERKTFTVYPSEEQVYTWTNYSQIDQIKVVIVGQDPYHEDGQAHGLAFSVPHGTPIPSSLENIFEELKREIPNFNAPYGNLSGWSQQGVLLLNSCLTVQKGEAGFHEGKGWEKFTDAIISYLSENSYGLVFILWGRKAQKKKKKKVIDESKHFILEGAHPSDQSVIRSKNGFFSRKADGARNENVPQYFLECNQILRALGKDEIDWHRL